MQRVFPAPGPASTSTGSMGAQTAFHCCGKKVIPSNSRSDDFASVLKESLDGSPGLFWNWDSRFLAFMRIGDFIVLESGLWPAPSIVVVRKPHLSL